MTNKVSRTYPLDTSVSVFSSAHAADGETLDENPQQNPANQRVARWVLDSSNRWTCVEDGRIVFAEENCSARTQATEKSGGQSRKPKPMKTDVQRQVETAAAAEQLVFGSLFDSFGTVVEAVGEDSLMDSTGTILISISGRKSTRDKKPP